MGLLRPFTLVLSAWQLITLGKHRHAPPRHQWPGQYKVNFDIRVPIVSRTQSTPLVYKYEVWQDEEHGRQKVVRDGVETTLSVLDSTGDKPSLEYDIYPDVNVLACRTIELNAGKGPHRRRQQRRRRQLAGLGLGSGSREGGAAPEPEEEVEAGPEFSLNMVLPDLTDKKWVWEGTEKIPKGRHRGVRADKWVWRLNRNYGYGKYHDVYTFLAERGSGRPLALNMVGFNLISDAHFDNYPTTFYDYQEGDVDESHFDPPDFCPTEPQPPGPNAGAEEHSQPQPQLPASAMAKWRTMLPNRFQGDAEYDAFVHAHGRRHGSAREYQERRQQFHATRSRVEAHNREAGEDGHRLGVNHFADLSDAEFRALMLPNAGRPRPRVELDGVRARQHVPKVPAAFLPAAVDWRGTPADSPVKDQALCGSCWAFGSTSSLETRVYHETGKQVLLSEQNLMDCSWAFNNTSCLGGFQILAYNYLADALEIATEEAYPYKGVSDFCRRNASSYVRFRSFSQVWVNATEGYTQEEAVMEALLTKGPMTVSVNANSDVWRYYRSGVYNQTDCVPQLKQLDHAVILSGYGRTESGQRYWIVKNTWSSLWGEDGYIRISREPEHDCGIATQAIYTDFTVDAIT